MSEFIERNEIPVTNEDVYNLGQELHIHATKIELLFRNILSEKRRLKVENERLREETKQLRERIDDKIVILGKLRQEAEIYANTHKKPGSDEQLAFNHIKSMVYEAIEA